MAVKSRFTRADVEILEKKTAYKGRFQIDRYRLRHRRHEGGWTEAFEREVFERGHAAAVLPYDPIRDEVVLIEQFRPGAYAGGIEPWLIEIVAGIIDAEDGSAEAVARREATEEAGLELGAVEPIARCIMSPGGCSETVQIYVGRVDGGTGGVFGLAHEHEDIRVLVLPVADAAELVASGKISNAITLIALQWLLLNRLQLRARWGAFDR